MEKVKKAISSLLQDHPLEPAMDFEFNLVAEELITNIISYAFADGLEHEFHAVMQVTDDSWSLTLEDSGQPFNPLEAAEPDINRPLSERAVGGLGIFMVRKIADVLQYERKEDRNILHAGKKVRA